MSDDRPRPNAFVHGIHILLWIAAGGGAVLGFGFSAMSCVAANGAPQQAAGAAVGCIVAIAPYVAARAFDEMTDYHKYGR